MTDEQSLRAGRAALLARGVPVVADVEMVAAEVTTRDTACTVRQATAREGAHAQRGGRKPGVRAGRAGSGVGRRLCPTALFELIALDARPALVVGLPVGFVGAAGSEAALRESGLPAISHERLAELCRPGRVVVLDEAFGDAMPGEPYSLAGRADVPGSSSCAA